MSGFKEFIMRGNVMDLAVAVIIGAAFTKIVTSLTEDVIMPFVGWISGGVDFSSYYLLLGRAPAGIDAGNYEALKAAGVPMIGYGALITAAVNFLIVAFIIYLMITGLKKAMRAKEAIEPDAEEVVLLREIRDELRANKAATSKLP